LAFDLQYGQEQISIDRTSDLHQDRIFVLFEVQDQGE
jgi:hypothetical protein